MVIQPGYEWEGHEPGQYLRIGVDLNGRRHWRAYSLTSDPKREDGCISITVKNVDEGVVSPYLVRKGPHGAIVGLGGVEGDFLLPDPVPEKILFISAGSGITPIMSMLRSLDHEGDMPDTMHIHSAGTPEEVIFGDEMRGLADKHEKFVLHEQHTATDVGPVQARGPGRAVPGLEGARRPTSPARPDLLEALEEHWKEHGDRELLHMERFQPVLGGEDVEEGEGGTIKFLKSDTEAESDGSQPILVAGEEAGLELAYGCREGICHTCVGTLEVGSDTRPAEPGRCPGTTGRPSALASTRPRARSRSTSEKREGSQCPLKWKTRCTS